MSPRAHTPWPPATDRLKLVRHIRAQGRPARGRHPDARADTPADRTEQVPADANAARPSNERAHTKSHPQEAAGILPAAAASCSTPSRIARYNLGTPRITVTLPSRDACASGARSGPRAGQSERPIASGRSSPMTNGSPWWSGSGRNSRSPGRPDRSRQHVQLMDHVPMRERSPLGWSRRARGVEEQGVIVGPYRRRLATLLYGLTRRAIGPLSPPVRRATEWCGARHRSRERAPSAV